MYDTLVMNSTLELSLPSARDMNQRNVKFNLVSKRPQSKYKNIFKRYDAEVIQDSRERNIRIK